MTKKEDLVWRLKNTPTVNEVTYLVRDKIITTDEARKILFNEQEKNVEVKALKEQIKFLEGVIDRLTTKQRGWTWTYTPIYPTQIWYSSGSLSSGTFANLYGGTIGSSTAGSSAISINSSQLIQ